jgi:hypothetical protein
MNRRALAIFILVVVVCIGVSWGARLAASGAAPKLSRYVPSGALLYLQAKDFSSLLADWNGSSEKQLWLKSGNYEMFSRSRLFLRLADANAEFAKAAGIPTDTNFLKQVAGAESAVAIFDIGKLEFLYITRLPSGSATQSALWQTRGKCETRSAGGVTFFLRRDAESEREVAFAVDGDYLLLATREDLLAGALQLMANDETKSSTAVKSMETEAWWSQAVAAAGSEGDLRMVLNLEKIVPSPHFRSYWVQKNATEMKQYSAAISDLVRSGNEYREERVLLRKVSSASNSGENATSSTGATPATVAAAPPVSGGGPAAVADIVRFVPAEAGVYKAKANPSPADCLTLLESKILVPHFGPGPAEKFAPLVGLGGGETGSSADLETRIDVAPVVAEASNDSEAALKELLAGNAVSATLQVESSEPDKDGVFVRIHSAVALLGQSDWNEAAVRSALGDFVRPSLTTGELGIEWQKNSGYFELNGLRTLEVAVRGKYLLVANDGGLLSAMLGRANQKTSQPAADYLAGFDHARERGNFARLTGLLDRPQGDPGAGNAPAFFSGNLASLSSTLAGVTSERIAVHEAADRVTQTITYTWAH